MYSSILLHLILLFSISVAGECSPEPHCTNIVLSVEACATNVVVNIQGDIKNRTVIENYIQGVTDGTLKLVTGSTQEVSGTYNISATYCRPTRDVPRLNSTVQLLVHGLTYNKGYWSSLTNQEFFLQNGSQYSWSEFANARGYHTLAIDRLGDGASSRPDPVSIVQLNFQTPIHHEVVQKLRQGIVGDVQFSTVIWVGHSGGSFLGQQLAAAYPLDLDVMILTGFAAIDVQAEIAAVLPIFTPATGITNLLPGYLTLPSAAIREELFYAGNYNPVIPVLDFAVQDTTTVGEIANLELINATKYTGDVFVLTGAQDAIFCRAGCGAGDNNVLARAAAYVPLAKSYEYYEVPATGHDINLHYSAPVAFAHAHNWLCRHGH
jgi:pimeloyl-ACP methyl ester carboxylesterase